MKNKNKDLDSGCVIIIIGNKRFYEYHRIGDTIFFLWKNRVLKRKVEGIKFKFDTFDDWDIEPEYEVQLHYIIDIDGDKTKIKSQQCFPSLESLRTSLKLDKYYSLE